MQNAMRSACRGGGKIIPPARFGLGQDPVFWAGSGPEENSSIWAEIDPTHFWAEIGPTLLG